MALKDPKKYKEQEKWFIDKFGEVDEQNFQALDDGTGTAEDKNKYLLYELVQGKMEEVRRLQEKQAESPSESKLVFLGVFDTKNAISSPANTSAEG